MSPAYDRPIEATLHVHLANGETWEAGPDDYARFDLAKRSAAYRIFEQAMIKALRAAGLIERDKHITDTQLNPLRYLVETAVVSPHLIDHRENEGWSAVAHIERLLREHAQARADAQTTAEAGEDGATKRLVRAVDALRLIDRHGCENLTEPHRCIGDSDRARGAQYAGEDWCAPCIARDALTRMGFQ